MTDYILYKPRLPCLLTHQLAWEEKKVVVVDIGEMICTFCNHCKTYFKYPSERDKPPVYSK